MHGQKSTMDEKILEHVPSDEINLNKINYEKKKRERKFNVAQGSASCFKPLQLS